MLSLSAKIRKELGSKVKKLRKENILPAILYGPEIKAQPLEVDLEKFEKVYQGAGESALISLEVEGQKARSLVLIHEVKSDPIDGKPIHADFYQPILTKEIEATVPLVFEGEAPAVKELGGTLVKEIQELKVKVLPQDIPHQIKIEVGVLKTFEDEILVKDIEVPSGVKILREPDEIVASVLPPEKVEEELEKPIEEKVEEVEKIEKEEKEEKEKAEEVSQEKT